MDRAPVCPPTFWESGPGGTGARGGDWWGSLDGLWAGAASVCVPR